MNADGNIQVNEVGKPAANFGQMTVRPDPALARGYNWEYSAVLQHELFPRVSVTAGYYRRDFYNLQVNDNLNLAASDWITPFTVPTPSDSRLPAAGQPIQLYSLNPAKVGVATDTIVTYSDVNKTTYNGVEFTANVRRNKFLAFGGITYDRRASTTCDVRDNQNDLRFCDAVPPFRTTVKASAAYTLPWEVNLSGSFSSIPGPSVSANYTVTIGGRRAADHRFDDRRGVDRDQPDSSRGRCSSNTQNRLDLRVGKTFRFGQTKIQGSRTSSTCFNAGTVLTVNQTYAAAGVNAWMTPNTISDGRYVRFGLQMSF